MKSLLLLLLLSTITFGQTIEEQVKKFDKPKSYTVKYDKFAKSTTVDFETRLQAPGTGFVSTRFLTLEISATIKDSGERRFLLWFTGQSRIYSDPTLRLLIDGKLLDLASVSGIAEYAAFSVTPKQWDKITAAKSVEVQLLTFESKFDDKLIKVMKNLASLKPN